MSTDPPGAALTPLRLLIVEDSAEDAQLIIREVVRAGYDPTWKVVDTAEQMAEALVEQGFDVVLSDWSLPRFSGLRAFELLQRRHPEVPLLLVSGTVGEESVASAINAGVRDFVLKDHLERLGPALRRALAHEAERRRREEAERALRQSEARYRDLFESYPQPMWVYDQETLSFLAVNNAAVAHYGYRSDEFLAMSILDIRPPEDRAAVMANVASTAPGFQRSGVFRHRKKDGTVIFVDVASHELRFGSAAARLVLATDVTDLLRSREDRSRLDTIIDERNRARQALQQSEQRVRLLLDSTAEAIFGLDLNGRCTFTNAACLRMLGFADPEELLGRDWHDALHHSKPDGTRIPEADCRIRAAFRTGENVHVNDEVLWRKDGTSFPVEYWSYPIREGGVVIGSVVTFLDITERKRTAEERLELEAQLRQSQKMEAMGRLASGVAHDFNNLLTVISGYGEILLETLPPGSVYRDAVEQIASAGDKAAGLTRQLLAFSRKQVQAPQVLDLNGVVRDMDKLLRRMIGEDVDISTSLDPVLSKVLADRGQIEQLVMNLAVNARDAMPEGGKLTLETRNVDLDEAYVRSHLRVRPGSYVMLAVSDTGIGMDEATLSHIFEPFFTTKEAGKGTGLGLSTVHGIVEQSGGNLWVYSVPERGTTFKVYLPRTEPEAADRRAASTQRPPAAARGSETILLIDDDAAVRRLTREVLIADGYTVIDAALADDALRIARESPGVLHLLITDVVMPGSSGPDLAERIQELRPRIKVLFMSGYSDVAITRHRILSEGASFLTKPFTPATLAKRVREVLRG